MKRRFSFFLLLLLLVLFGAIESRAQTFGGGITVTGNTNALLQSSPGVVVTNTASVSIPPKAMVLSGIANTNETAIGYYGFQVPANFYLMPGTTNVYVIASFTNSFAGGTNSGTFATNFAGIYGTTVPLIGVMGLSIGAYTNSVYVP